MSITSIINRNNYIGNDSTAVYPYTFKVFTKNDFEIKVRNISTGVETLLTVDVNYTVSGAGTVAGGNITLIGSGAWIVSSKLTAGYELSIRRLRDIKQLADIKNQGSFYPETHEDVFDKLTMVDLQQQDSIDRSVKLPSSIDPAVFDTDIPASMVGAVSRAFITNATGDGFDVGPTADEISNAQSYAIAADASADAAALSEAAADASADAAALSEANAAAAAVVAAAAEIATHAALTNTHGVSGDIVGTSDAQVITNKDIDGGVASNTRRITLPKDVKTNLDFLTRKQGTLVYDTTSNKPYYDDGTNLKVIGSGSGSITNFVTDGNADEAPSSIFIPYADAAGTRPVDGTGGSPTVATSITSTSPLDGTKSFLLTKPASNVQGQGWSVPFTVSLGYFAKSCKISFQYIVNSGTFVAGSSTTESDIIWYLYDVTNSQLIEPSNIKMFSSNNAISDNYQAEFQTSATGTSYRLIGHVQSTSALAYELKVDNISVAPSQYVYAAPITDLVSYGTLTIGATTTAPVKGSTLTDIVRMGRIGDHARIQGVYYQNALGSATTGSGDYLFTLPGGVSFDSTKVKFEATVIGLNSWGNGTQLGSASASNGVAAVDTGVGVVLPYDATRFRIGIIYTNSSTTTKGVIGSGYFALTHATRSFSFDFQAPIQGWTSNQQVSDGYDARDLTFSGTQSSQAVTANTTNIAFTATKDSAASWNGTQYTVKSAGDYFVVASLITSAQTTLYIKVNGTQLGYLSTTQTGGLNVVAGAQLLTNLVAGDVITLISAASVTLSNGRMSISKNQAPTTMSRGATVGANYSTTATTAYTSGSLAVFAPNTKISDYGAGGTYDTATGEFTASTSMQLQVDYHIQFSSASWTANTRLSVVLYKNGSTSGQENTSPYAQSTQSFVMADKGTFTIDVVAGDIIKLMVDQNSTSSKSLAGFAATNRITFKRAGG